MKKLFLFALTIIVASTFLTGCFENKSKYMIIDLPTGKVSYADVEPIGICCLDVYKTTKLVLRRIEPGTFVMGSPTSELGRRDNEKRYDVKIIKPFYIGVFEITQKQYQLIAGYNPSEFKGDTKPVHNVSYNDIRGREKGAAYPDNDEVDDYSFFGKLRARSKMNFDLPTEAQWEYACRAGTTTALNNGTDLSDISKDKNLDILGFYVWNGGRDGEKDNGPTVVGSYRPNFWGIYDMHGNVYEWVLDKYEQYDGDAMHNSYRVLRGGGWDCYASGCRSASRHRDYPDDVYNSFGFRAALVQ